MLPAQCAGSITHVFNSYYRSPVSRTSFDYRRLDHRAYLVYGLCVAALVAVPLVGTVGGGSRRWLRIGSIAIQPSEFMKPALVVLLAHYFARGERDHHSLLQVIPLLILVALPAGLVLLWSWRRRLLRGEPALPPWVEGVVWGTMPLVHLHTFLFVSILGAAWAYGAGRWRAALPSLVWAFPLAAWSTFQVTDGFRAASLVGWKPGWTIGAQNPLGFLLVNFGLFLPLALAAHALALREGREQFLR